MAVSLSDRRHAPDVSLRARDEVPGVKIFRRTRERTHAFHGQQVRFDCGGNAAGDFILHGEHVTQIAVVRLSP